MNYPILYIHGAGASRRSFEHIICRLPDHNDCYFDWDVNEHLSDTLHRLAQLIPTQRLLDNGFHIVAHSLGGVLAVNAALLFPKQVKSVTTLSTPFGGVDLPLPLRMMHWSSTFVKNVHPHHPVIEKARRGLISCPILTVTSTGGHNELLGAANDGAVSVDSQLYLRSTVNLVTKVNHFEVLLDDWITNSIAVFISDEDLVEHK